MINVLVLLDRGHAHTGLWLSQGVEPPLKRVRTCCLFQLRPRHRRTAAWMVLSDLRSSAQIGDPHHSPSGSTEHPHFIRSWGWREGGEGGGGLAHWRLDVFYFNKWKITVLPAPVISRLFLFSFPKNQPLLWRSDSRLGSDLRVRVRLSPGSEKARNKNTFVLIHLKQGCADMCRQL